MDDAVIRPLSSWWRARTLEGDAARALAQLCVQLAARVDRDAGVFLATRALELVPTSLEALSVLERATTVVPPRILCARYESFLAHAGDDPRASAVRERLAMLLLEQGLVYSALLQVDASLATLGGAVGDVGEIIPTYTAEAADAHLDELARYLEGDPYGGYIEAAE
jgi:hypothetical protein